MNPFEYFKNTLLMETAMQAAAVATRTKLPRLVLHFDVNETILVNDPVRAASGFRLGIIGRERVCATEGNPCARHLT